MYRCLLALFFSHFGIDGAECAQRFISSYRFSSLAKQEVILLADYLTQIESLSTRSLPDEQTIHIVREFDGYSLRMLDKQESLLTRQQFKKRRLLIASDWTYYTQQKIPDGLRDCEEEGWDLHHIVFIRLNGQNQWWNVIPLLRRDHHKTIHGKGQPGEVLHRHLAARLSGANSSISD